MLGGTARVSAMSIPSVYLCGAAGSAALRAAARLVAIVGGADADPDRAEQPARDHRFRERVTDVGEQPPDLGDVDAGHHDRVRQRLWLGAREMLHDVHTADLRQHEV